jgi:hypothetical protein
VQSGAAHSTFIRKAGLPVRRLGLDAGSTGSRHGTLRLANSGANPADRQLHDRQHTVDVRFVVFAHSLPRLAAGLANNFDFGWLAAARFMTGRALFGDGFFLATLMTLGAISGLASIETTFHASDFDAF